MPVSELDLEQLTALFRLLSDKTRLNILLLLAAGEQNVTWLCNQLNLPQPTVSHHLGLLRMNSIIANRRSGKQVFYHLNGRVDREDDNQLSIHTAHYAVAISRTGEGASIRATAHSELEPVGAL
jgi:DNA-binding transcriptional ArsR family regulator